MTATTGGPDSAPVPTGHDEAGAGGTHEELHGPFFWICLVVGWAVIVFGLHGLIADANQTHPPALARLLIGLNIVNDALVAPLLVTLAVLSRRLVPRWALVPVQIGLIISAVVVLYAYPLLGDWGRTARAGYSRLPWDYAHNVAVVLGAVWLVCAVLVLWLWRRSRPTPG